MANMAVSAKMPHDTLSASWTTRKTSCAIQSMSTAPRIRGWWCRAQSDYENTRTRGTRVQGQEKTEVLAQGKSELTLPRSFCSNGVLWKFNDAYPHWGGSSALFSSPIQMLISSRNIPRNNIYQLFGHSLAQPS